ncbi:MAG TPA: zinc ribbon domain-containing protein [Patescibacteria group bacterium]|nr:zinc ribbon domain-containing protein [Patescibacteria group bacterium]
MPIYEYRCAACDHPFEAFVRNGDSAECPDCRSTKLTRELSTFAARSNGNGTAAAEAAIANSGTSNGGSFSSGGGCCGGGCGCH